MQKCTNNFLSVSLLTCIAQSTNILSICLFTHAHCTVYKYIIYMSLYSCALHSLQIYYLYVSLLMLKSLNNSISASLLRCKFLNHAHFVYLLMHKSLNKLSSCLLTQTHCPSPCQFAIFSQYQFRFEKKLYLANNNFNKFLFLSLF